MVPEPARNRVSEGRYGPESPAVVVKDAGDIAFAITVPPSRTKRLTVSLVVGMPLVLSVTIKTVLVDGLPAVKVAVDGRNVMVMLAIAEAHTRPDKPRTETTRTEA